MAKLTLNIIGSRYGSIDALNDNFDAIEQALENTLSLDGTIPNALEADLDLNSNDILNAGEINTDTLRINGVLVEPTTGLTAGAAFQTYEFTAIAGQTTFSVSPATPYNASIVVIVNGLQLSPAEVSVSGTNVITPALTLGDEVVIRRYTAEPVAAPDASEVNFIQAGTGAVTRTSQNKMRDVVSVKDFGAVGDGVTDDTAAIQAAIDAVVSGGRVLGDAQSTFAVAGRINLSNKELRDIRLIYTSNNAFMVVGGKARLTNTTISVGSTIRTFAAPLPGVINLHLATGVVIDNVEITDGITDRIGVFCSTLASNTTIRNCRMNYIGWPILYNDYVPAQRIVDGINYAGQSIGRGLYVYDCELGASDKTAVGDAIEINCPSARFNNTKVNNCVILKTNTSGSANGLGMGFANIDTLQVSNCLLRNVANNAGAIHMEAHTTGSITNNTIELCSVGIGLGVDGQDTLIDGNTIKNCDTGIQCLGGATSMRGVTISANQILDTDDYPIIFQNVNNGIISNNFIKDVATSSRQYLNLQQTGGLTTTNHIISGNIFARSFGADNVILSTTGTVTEIYSQDNAFPGQTGVRVGAYLTAVRAVGLSKDHYKTAGLTSGIFGTATTDPTGYITGSTGDFVTDVNAGIIYRFDGATWVVEVS